MSRNTRFKYSKNRVNRAGENIRNECPSEEDLAVIQNWRAAHNHILNSWQATLRGRCRKYNIGILAQRLKREKTIFEKLIREPDMRLARMHDIAGCRLIFKNLEDLNTYRAALHQSRMTHIKKGRDYNYIQCPAASGYRGIHDVYEYKVRKSRPDDWNGLLVEIQYRTVFQHAWATAVEVAGALTGNQTKFDQGHDSHKEFFRLSSEVLARAHENSHSCYPDIDTNELLERFHTIENETSLLRTLSSLRLLHTGPMSSLKKNIILVFSQEKSPNGNVHQKITFYDYKLGTKATEKYFELEQKAQGEEDIVLVKADSIGTIKNAFRNYFSNASDFVSLINKGLQKLK